MLSDKNYWRKLIEEALTNKAEYNFLDFKTKLSDKNERLKEHINAFGNLECGGCFVFGVQAFVPIGLEEDWDPIVQKVTHLAKTTQEPSLSVDTFPLIMNHKQLLCIHVLPGISKPVFIKDRSPLGGQACFKRSGSSTVTMSIQEIKDLLVNTREHYYDGGAVSASELDALDFDKLQEYLPQLDKVDRWSIKNISILIDHCVLTGIKNAPQITVAGWLCFANSPQSIREFRNAYIEFQIFQGVSRSVPAKKYEIKGDLSSQIEQSIQLLQQNIWYVPKIESIKREDTPAYSDVVLREVITNSLVHRDYKKMHQPVKIAMFDDRIEIENPGGLMPGLTIYNLIHKRDWRNPLLAELMKKFGFGEMDGQGIDRLYAATLIVKTPPPVFIDHHHSFTVILWAPRKYEQFTPEQKRLRIVILAIMNEAIDNESVRNAFDISAEKAGTLIKAMVDDNILQSHSTSRKYAKYKLTEEYRDKIFG